VIGASVQFESDMRVVRIVFLNALLPVAMALFLIHVRSKYGVARYIVAAMPFLAFALVYCLFHEDVRLGLASGFSSSALLGALASVAAICALRTRTRWVQAAQVLVAFLATNFWLVNAYWVA